MKRVLVAPLDWGLGHATRSIPIIHALLNRNCEVVIGGNGDSLTLLMKEFPSLASIRLPAYNPEYPRGEAMAWKMALQIPKFIGVIRREHHAVEKIISEKKIDIIISDNRYGIWSSRIPSVLITHQSNILMPKRFGWLQNLVRFFNHRQMKKFSVCWIPDYPGGNSFAGDLAHFGSKPEVHHEFIGLLSRFTYEARDMLCQIVVILSGPEPQRTILEKILVPQVQKSGLKYFIVLGQLTRRNSYNNPNIVDFLISAELQEKILSSELVIARSGYSSIMDLASLRKKAILIPTPGQTEQEYLAKTLKEKGVAFSMPQNVFDLKTAIAHSKNYVGFSDFSTEDLLGKALIKILKLREPQT
jgi:uncharacterized protein (TIGR00661 family)